MPLGRAIESCRVQLRSWRPFGRTQGSDSVEPRTAAAKNGPYRKRICRATSFPYSSVLDMSKLCFFDDDKSPSFPAAHGRRLARKRLRRGGSRSVSGQSSVGVSTVNGTCSDFLMAAGSTDSSGELFWGSERNFRREKEENGGGEREYVIAGVGLFVSCDIQGNESGYGSESGYKGDVELEYGDELDEEEDDGWALFWAEEHGENTSQLEKGHQRRRCKKKDI